MTMQDCAQCTAGAANFQGSPELLLAVGAVIFDSALSEHDKNFTTLAVVRSVRGLLA